MALKDWKKVKSQKGYIQWKKGRQIIDIEETSPYFYEFNSTSIQKKFSAPGSKIQALAFAKAYMRKH